MRSLNFEVLTLFPGILEGPLNESILKRGREKGLLNVTVRNIRDYTEDKHKTADDSPYGGGAGMVLKPEPIFKAFEALKVEHPGEKLLTILLSPQGRLFNQQRAEQLSEEDRRIVLLCGHYEAIDERVIDAIVDEELSIGDYVLTGGELAALVVIDASIRLCLGSSAMKSQLTAILLVTGCSNIRTIRGLWNSVARRSRRCFSPGITLGSRSGGGVRRLRLLS
jgi:tRNA (guanine37-N1)-methyltransferase